MLKAEMKILTAIALYKCICKQQITTHSIARDNPYIILTLDSLVRNGYIANGTPKGYQITLKGAQALLEFLHDNSTIHNFASYRLLYWHLTRIIHSTKHEATKRPGTSGTKGIKKLAKPKKLALMHR